MIAVLAVALVGALVIAAIAAWSAAQAHDETAHVCREMATTWSAIARAQLALRSGPRDDAIKELDDAAATIRRYRTERGR